VADSLPFDEKRMKPMGLKRLLLAAMAPVLVAGPVLANTCMRPEERKAADTWAMNSYMRVIAMQCKIDRARMVDAFQPHRGELSAAANVIQGYFRRAHGGAGQTRFDQYYTNISQDHAMDATRAGAFFCRDADVILSQIKALPPGGLAPFSVRQNIIQPISAPDCGAGAAAPQRSASAARR
jgi:hypothetical protein